MACFNKSLIMGYLTKDPIFARTATTCYAIFNVGVNNMRINKDKKLVKEAVFIPCIAFGATAKFIYKYMVKGTNIVVDGYIRMSYMKPSVKGEKNTPRLEIVCREVTFGSDNANHKISEDDLKREEERKAHNEADASENTDSAPVTEYKDENSEEEEYDTPF